MALTAAVKIDEIIDTFKINRQETNLNDNRCKMSITINY